MEVLLENILSRNNLLASYNRVVGNKGASGIDGMTVDDLGDYLKENWESIRLKIEQGKYKPSAVRRVSIPKPNGGERHLGIPTVLDRMVQHSISEELNKLYDPIFSEYSYGFRKGRDAHQALNQSLDYIEEGYEYMVSKRISDKEVLRLIRRYLQSGIMDEGVETKNEEGTPQGGNLSPILSNIVLDELDKELESRGHRFVRYADDISIFVKTSRSGLRVLESVSNWISKCLKLKIKLKRLTKRSWSVSLDYRFEKLRQTMQGWLNYYGLAAGKKRIVKLDEWLRRRVRMCIWKTWKRVRTKMRSLIKLGIPKKKAYMWANTRKGYWEISGSPILQTTITNRRLEKRGYRSLLSYYLYRHSILMNRRDTRTVRPVV